MIECGHFSIDFKLIDQIWTWINLIGRDVWNPAPDCLGLSIKIQDNYNFFWNPKPSWFNRLSLIHIYVFHINSGTVSITSYTQSFKKYELTCVFYYFLRAQRFDSYVEYCTNKPHSTQLLVAHGGAYFEGLQRRFGLEHPIAAYLIKPVQRITKYQLLLKDLLSCCDQVQWHFTDFILQYYITSIVTLSFIGGFLWLKLFREILSQSICPFNFQKSHRFFINGHSKKTCFKIVTTILL